MKIELFPKKFNAGHWRTLNSGNMPMLSDLQLVYMVPRNSISTQLLKINTTKFQVERDRASLEIMISVTLILKGIYATLRENVEKMWNFMRLSEYLHKILY